MDLEHVPLQNLNPLPAADIVCNLGGKALVVHEEEVDLTDVVDHQLLQAVGEEVAGLIQIYETMSMRMPGYSRTFLLLP